MKCKVSNCINVYNGKCTMKETTINGDGLCGSFIEGEPINEMNSWNGHRFTDLSKLPVGTEFEVINGCWTGHIVEVHGEKCVRVDATGSIFLIKGNEELAVEIIENVTEVDLTDEEIPY